MDEAGSTSGQNDRATPSEVGWIDTHCHLDASEFDLDRDAVVDGARANGVRQIVIPAVHVGNFAAVRALAHRIPGAAYALGIHPMATPHSQKSDIERLLEALEASRDDPKLVAIGEIGLDYFVTDLKSDSARDTQEWFYREQLKLARRFALPVILHVRRSADRLLKDLRQIEVPGGIGHAFNGSEQQAQGFVDLGFRLGFGGAMTFERALQIRRLAQSLPETVPVLETDAPDIAPAWLYRQRNAPGELPRIAETLALLRRWSPLETARITTENAYAALPRLKALGQSATQTAR
ncbi:MAG: TatD family hydrolase [Burkholderiaceae bacterium]|jgi:TatD DNase family protein